MVTTNAVRYPVSSVIAVGLMAGFFFALFTIISQRPPIAVTSNAQRIDFTPKIKSTEPEHVRTVKPIREILPTPPSPGLTRSGDVPLDAPLVPQADVVVPPTGFRGFVDTTEAPLVRQEPAYPRNLITRGIEGWVELQFTVSGSGAVTDVMVVDADPRGAFDAAAIKAVQSWKYAPRVREGRAVERRGMRVVLRFNLD